MNRLLALPVLAVVSIHGSAPAQAWIQHPPGPNQRIASAMAENNGRVLLFGGFGLGGQNRPTVLDDTWEWDPFFRTWLQVLTATQPASRSGHAMASWPGIGVVMCGGVTLSGAQFTFETWLFDGLLRDWVPASGTGPTPSPRRFHALAALPSLNGLLLFGGEGFPSNSPLNDTWLFDGTSWQALPGQGPSARGGAAMGLHQLEGRVILFGGRGTGGLLGDTWAFDGATSSWSQLSIQGPPARSNAAMAFDGETGVILFGGNGSTQVLGDTWRFDGTWKQLQPLSTPSARQNHAMVGLLSGEIWMHGGQDSGSNLLPDMLAFGRGTNLQRLRPCGSPAPELVGSEPALGTTQILEVQAANTATSSILSIGSEITSPIDLAALGITTLLAGDATNHSGCFWGVATNSSAVLVPPAMRLGVAIPSNQALLGGSYSAQAVVLDPSAGNAAQALVTNALRSTIVF